MRNGFGLLKMQSLLLVTRIDNTPLQRGIHTYISPGLSVQDVELFQNDPAGCTCVQGGSYLIWDYAVVDVPIRRWGLLSRIWYLVRLHLTGQEEEGDRHASPDKSRRVDIDFWLPVSRSILGKDSSSLCCDVSCHDLEHTLGRHLAKLQPFCTLWELPTIIFKYKAVALCLL